MTYVLKNQWKYIFNKLISVIRLTEGPVKLLHNQLRNNHMSTLTITDVKYVQNNIHHARNSVYPNFLRNINEVHAVLTLTEIKTFANIDYIDTSIFI